jgi:hypothetical protein
MLKIADIRRVQIELTTRCNARCPMCMRNYRGMAFNSGYPVTELTLDNIKHILKPDCHPCGWQSWRAVAIMRYRTERFATALGLLLFISDITSSIS